MEDIKLYPLRFIPIIKNKIWGGHKLKNILGKDATDQSGESWEISGVEGYQSIISNGPLKGKPLDEVISVFKEKLLGIKIYSKFGSDFPLLIKFIDANTDLSIQVHPSDIQSNGRGKTEMWYVMQADPGAYLLSGFNQKITKHELKDSIKNGEFESYMNKVLVKSGDTFFIEANHVHSIGAGVMLAEIQQTSDITYRIYDFNRKDQGGNLRELHIDKAFEVMNLGLDTGQVNYENSSITKLVSVPEFHTTKYKITDILHLESPIDHFIIVIGVRGKGTIIYDNLEERFSEGDTVLIPAGIKAILRSKNGLEVLETCIKG